MVGRTLDRYELLEQVGHGGMAIVYRALDIPLNREVAVKVLHPHLAKDEHARARLQREAQAVAKLRHPSILQIFASSGVDSPECYLVTEFIHGPTLKELLTNRLPFPEIGAMIASELATALSCAHEVGIIHRDVKPENVMVRSDGTLVLCDFGIAQVIDKDRMTATGQLLGSPAYMAPEHIEGEPLDCRTDIFSLGVLLYQLVCGELPFKGRNPHETLKRITDGHFTPPDQLAPLCSRRLGGIIRKALCRDPAGRYDDAKALRRELTEMLAESGISDAQQELRGYLRDPAGWTAAFRGRLLQALIGTGQRLREQRRTAAALEAWHRAALLEPENAEVRGLIRRVSAGRAWRRRGAAALGLAALGLTALAGERLYVGPRSQKAPAAPASPAGGSGADQPAPPAPPSSSVQVSSSAPPSSSAQVASSAPPSSSVPTQSTSAEARSPLPLAPAAAGGRGEGSPPHRARTRTAASPQPPARSVRLSPWPKAVRVSLNGTSLGEYGSDVRTVTLRPGDNTLLFENPACYSERVTVSAAEDPGEVRVRLRWKPALLVVKVAGPPAAEVVVDGHILGRSGQLLAIPVKTEDGKLTAQVHISATGYESRSRSVELRANQLSSVQETLEP